LTDVCLIADYFYKDLIGGAELNDFSVIQRLEAAGISVKEMHCHNVTVEFLKKNKQMQYIVANFVLLPEKVKQFFISERLNYVIYEHDHKYLKRRNPIFYKDFIAPDSDLANVEFYKTAKAVVCLTQLAVDVFKANTGLENVAKIGASVWTDEDLDFISDLSNTTKNNKFAIVDSNNPIKKREKCIQFCEARDVPYDLISDRDHRRFLEKLSKYKGLAFMTGHLETCCRLVVEAKMMNCKVITQQRLIGAASEPWFELNGIELVESIREISKKSLDVFLGSFDG
jgi:hypothetical protein